MPHIQTQTEWEEEMSQKIISFIRNELYVDLRFFDVALSGLQPKAIENLQAFSTNGIYLYYASPFVLRIFEKNSKYLNRMYLHTILHCLFSHLWLIGDREKQIWDIACDIVVEYTIDKLEKPSTRRALSWLRVKTYERLSFEKEYISAAIVYRKLKELEEEELLLIQREFFTDDHVYWPKKEDNSMQNQQAKQNWDKIRKQTQMNQERQGDETTNDGEQVLASQLKANRSQRSYKEFLQKFSVLKEEVQIDPDEFDMSYYSYGLRIFKNMPLIEPLETKEVRKILEFVIVLDTSYSTNGELVKNFLNETFGILKERSNFFHDSRIRILQCDDQVRMDEVIKSEQELNELLYGFTLLGGGGTDFRPAFSYVNELIRRGEIKNLGGLLYFTDGKGIYPSKSPEYKTAFLFLEHFESENVPAWAMTLQLDSEEFLTMERG